MGEGREPSDVHEPAPGRVGPVHHDRPVHDAGLRVLKNAHYWQAGKPKIGCLEYVQATSNDSALALIQSGQVDWTHNFVANVEKAYTSKDPAHFHSFYATTAYPQSLVFDTTQYPYNLVAFRKALSQAIDRQSISKLGEYGYAPATSALGIEFLFPQWVTDAT